MNLANQSKDQMDLTFTVSCVLTKSTKNIGKTIPQSGKYKKIKTLKNGERN
jgi:hypothetical protein